MAMTITHTGIRNLGWVNAVICAVVLLRIRLKSLYQMFHANATGQESRSFRLHQRESTLTSIIDPHDPREINDKVTFGMSVTSFLPVGIKVRNPRVSEPTLENEPLLGLSVDPRNLQHRFPSAGRRVSLPLQQLAQAHPPLGQAELLAEQGRADAA